ncbi:MAG: TerB family tellurite resistance protein [Burkholderiales bacterium]|nr:TerB family tellurite resistance protein [Burkholderiales bacterium]
MLEKFLALLSTPPAPVRDPAGPPFARREIAVVALLVELAQSDRALDGAELAAIERIVRERFGLDAATAGRLIAAARAELDAALEDWVFANAVREGFTAAERVGIVELLWEVVYADGKLARLEGSQMRRVADELGIGDAERDAARAQAFARSGLARGHGPDAVEAE